jgi:hypothetical protein
MKIKNKFESYAPLMHQYEYEFIATYLNQDDILLEWGSGNSTIFWSGIVKKVISIEHDIDWINTIKKIIDFHDIKNIDLHHVRAHSPDPKPCRYAQFKDYVNFPIKEKFQFTKVLIDGRARKYCAKSLLNTIDENVIVFIHDFSRPDYQKTLKYYDIVDIVKEGQWIVALKKKSNLGEISSLQSEY